MKNQNPEECCPLFTQRVGAVETHEWDNKPFIRDTLPTLFHMPFPPMVGTKMTKLCDASDAAEATPAAKSDILAFFRDPSPFKSELLLSVTHEVPGADNVTLSGTFVSKVYDGPYGAAPKFMKDMDALLAERNLEAKEYYIHYAYCPKCSKKFGHNYTVLFAQV